MSAPPGWDGLLCMVALVTSRNACNASLTLHACTCSSLGAFGTLSRSCYAYFSRFRAPFGSSRRSSTIFRSRSVVLKIFSGFWIFPPPYLVHWTSGVTNMVLLSRISRRIPPRTCPEGRKILSHRFFRKTHSRCIFPSRFQIRSPNFEFPLRSGVIHVFLSSYYVNSHIFAFRAALLSLFFAPELVLSTSAHGLSVMMFPAFIKRTLPESYSLLKFGKTRFCAFRAHFLAFLGF